MDSVRVYNQGNAIYISSKAYPSGSLTATYSGDNITITVNHTSKVVVKNCRYDKIVDKDGNTWGASASLATTALNNYIGATNPDGIIKSTDKITDLTGITASDFASKTGYTVFVGSTDGSLQTSNAVLLDGNNLRVNGELTSSTNANLKLKPGGTGNVEIGNFEFDADQTGANDGDVLTFDSTSGTIALSTPTGGGGSSPWTTSGSDIYYTTGNVGVGTSSPGVALDIAGQINATSSTFPVLGFTRETTLTSGAFTGTNGIASAMELTTKTSGDMGDGFGGGIVFTLNDATETSTTNYVARIYARRDGADNTGALQFFTGASGNDPSMIIRGSGNVGIGTTTPAEALDVSGKANINDGSNNVLISTGNSTITATNTVGVGYQALTALTTGTQNTAVGYQAGDALTTGVNNTLVGYAAGTALTGSSNAIFGNSSGTAMTSGAGNVVVGSYAGNSITTRSNNVAIGNGSDVGSSTDYGVAVGGSATASGGYTTAMGYFAGNGSSGQWNVLNGFNTMRNSSGSYNAVCGGRSMYATGGSYNAVLGQGAMDGGGSNNDSNVVIGSNAFQNGSNNVIIGTSAASASGTLNNKLYIENSNSTTPLIYGEFDNDLVRINGDFEVTGGVKIEKTSNTDYDYRGDVVYFGATTSMTQGDLYYFNSSGNWAQADADAASSSGGVLLAIALGTASDTDGMLLRGTFTMEATAIDGTEATGDELYVSTTAGHITSDVSAYTTGDVVRVIGYCLDGTNGQIWFNPSNDFITLA